MYHAFPDPHAFAVAAIDFVFGRYQAQWKQQFPDKPLEWVIDWMHAKGHKADCEENYSGLFREGTGRRIGQQVEQLWAAMKSPAQLARYMTTAHWQEFVEAALLELEKHKQDDYLVQRASQQHS